MKTTGIERGTLSAFEDFLCALIRGSFDVTDVLKDNGVISVCQVCVLLRTYEIYLILLFPATPTEGSIDSDCTIRCGQAEED